MQLQNIKAKPVLVAPPDRPSETAHDTLPHPGLSRRHIFNLHSQTAAKLVFLPNSAVIIQIPVSVPVGPYSHFDLEFS